MENRSEQEIAESVWEKYELEIFNRLKSGESIHTSKYVQIGMEMERKGCTPKFALRFVDIRLSDILDQLAEREVAQ